VKKPKKGLIVLLIGLVAVALLVVFGVRYHQVNSQHIEPVKERMVKQNQLVKAPGIDFKVLKTSVSKNKDEVKVHVDLESRLTRKSSWGFHKNGKNYWENIWVNIPNGIRLRASEVKRMEGSIQPKDEKTNRISLTFPTSRWNYDIAKGAARFSILVPDGKNYIKYSVPVKE
jgi:hypothetical protein